MPATISAISHFVPPDIVDNHYFTQFMDTTDEWIKARTGISERRFLKEGATSDLIVPAAQKLFEQKGISKDDIDTIIVATVTPDHMFPSTAAVVQKKLGIKNCWGFDISAACSGFLFALRTACSLVESGMSKKLLLCGADKMSSILDMEDRTTAVLFGDGAGCCLIEMSDDPEMGVLDQILQIDGEGGKYLMQIAGGSFRPPSHDTINRKEHNILQDGQNVFKAAVKGMADVSEEIMKRNNLNHNDIKWLVPHQANLRIISATAERMGLAPDKVMINIDKYGNTTAGTIPICLSEWNDAGKIQKGDYVVLSSFGAGFTWGSILLRWNLNE